MSSYLSKSGKPAGVVEDGASRPDSRRSRTGSRLWFLWMVGMWVAFYVLLRSDRLEEVATWIRDLPLVVELGAWLLFFPWVLATAVWTSDWSEWLRVVLVVIFTAGWTIVSIPRRKTTRTAAPSGP
ncbi:hypothetical protein EV644_12934 [Kribbella orskensis]|uniref:Uncharacterized protein n=1 Tax=Kribbella orskensis TaxID=2512216 RepID=A0ABY2B8G4_9ACTN|nr:MULTISPECIES: hypothetical protein [Kribbella]TCN31160.1 hypothetical protein EV642_13134 [Kribbella sp. VKM Ac-2500]TCO11666.1 hypothetical protein EV644_12934 [Kribbella orskensis]